MRKVKTLFILSLLVLAVFPAISNVETVKATEEVKTVDINTFGNPTLPKALNITVSEDPNFVIVDNMDGFVFKFGKGTSGYNEIWENGNQIVANEQWVLEYLHTSGSYKQRGIPINVSWEQQESYCVIVKRFYDDFSGTKFNMTYIFRGGFRPKIIFEGFIGQSDVYRIVWKVSGINKIYIQSGIDSCHVKFWNDGEDGIVFDYSDVYQYFGNITTIEIDEWAGNHKLNEIFNVGLLSVGEFRLDPSFGYTQEGSYDNAVASVGQQNIRGSVYALSSMAWVTSITVALGRNHAELTGPVKCAIYRADDTLVDSTQARNISIPALPTYNWFTFNFSTVVFLVPANYIIVVWGYEDDPLGQYDIAYDLGGVGRVKTEAYTGTFPNTISWGGTSSAKHSIYANYSTLSNDEVTITDMEGCGNWVFAEEQYYHFQAKVSHPNGIGNIDTVKIAFSDGVHWVNASYDHVETEWGLDSGSDYVNIQQGSTSTSGNNLTVTYPIYFKNTILDALNVSIYLYANDTDGFECEWSEIAPDYFNIYNLGGFGDLETTGSSGRTTGGDLFELWAGGEYGADIFQENFEGNTLAGWQLYTPNETANYVEISTARFRATGSNFRSMHIVDSGAYTTYVMHTFRSQTGIFYSTTWVYPETTGEAISIIFEQQVSTFDKIGPWVTFEDNGKMYWWASGHNYIMDYSADTWYNVTLAINITAEDFDIYVGGTLKNSSASFSQAGLTYLNRLRLSTYLGGVPTTETSDVYIDDIEIWYASTGGYGGDVTATATFRRLQHIHTQFALGIPLSFNELDQANEGFIEFGIDACYNDTWLENAWKVQINITDANIVGTSFGTEANNWIKLKVSWYRYDTLIKYDYIYTFWEGGPGGLATETTKADYFRLWLDLWFNKFNASSIIGGRVNSYFYGMHDNANPWLQWWTGSSWGPMIEETSQSMFFENFVDTEGNLISCREIELFKIRVRVWRSENYDYVWKLRDFDILSIEQAKTVMAGIDTPIFVAVKTPEMAQGGFLGALSAGFSNIINRITEALGPAILGFWNNFVGFVDSIFSTLGWENGFSQILAVLNGVYGMVAYAVSVFIDIMTYAINIFITSFLSIFAVFMDAIGTVSTIVTWIGWMWAELYTYWGWFPEVFMQLLPLFFVFYILWALAPTIDGGNIHGTVQRIEDTVGLMWRIVNGLIQILDFAIDTAYRLIEIIPVVE